MDNIIEDYNGWTLQSHDTGKLASKFFAGNDEDEYGEEAEEIGKYLLDVMDRPEQVTDAEWDMNKSLVQISMIGLREEIQSFCSKNNLESLNILCQSGIGNKKPYLEYTMESAGGSCNDCLRFDAGSMDTAATPAETVSSYAAEAPIQAQVTYDLPFDVEGIVSSISGQVTEYLAALGKPQELASLHDEHWKNSKALVAHSTMVGQMLWGELSKLYPEASGEPWTVSLSGTIVDRAFRLDVNVTTPSGRSAGGWVNSTGRSGSNYPALGLHGLSLH